jgi:hypothetical protein
LELVAAAPFAAVPVWMPVGLAELVFAGAALAGAAAFFCANSFGETIIVAKRARRDSFWMHCMRLFTPG